MNEKSSLKHDAALLSAIMACFATSLLHFAHNAVYLHDYPNLPATLSSVGVYLAWCGVTAVGVTGYVVYRYLSRIMGLAIIVLYAVLGFGGLDHYVVAPVSAHSLMMNLTIALEVVAAMVLLIVTARMILLARRLK